jgi:nucleoside-diphosphate-sugar epimerase
MRIAILGGTRFIGRHIADRLVTDAVVDVSGMNAAAADAAPLREKRYVDGPDYENLEVEERYLAIALASRRTPA